MFPALTEFVQWQGRGEIAIFETVRSFKIHGLQLLTLHFIGIAPLLASQRCFERQSRCPTGAGVGRPCVSLSY
jgi:hypothetical protein